MEKYLIFEEETSKKFWHIRVEGTRTIVTFGRIGTKGQTQEKVFPTGEAAEKEGAKQTASKLKKGYIEASLPEKSDAEISAAISAATTAQKSAVLKVVNGSVDTADDGRPKPWHGDDWWQYSWYCPEDDGAFDHLEEAQDEPWDAEEPDKKAVPVDMSDEDLEFDEDDDEYDRQRKREKARINKMTPEELIEYERRIVVEYYQKIGKELAVEQIDEHVRDSLCRFISDKADWHHSYHECDKHIAALRIMIPDDAQYKAQMESALEEGMSGVLDCGYWEEDRITQLQWLLEKGAKPEGKMGSDVIKAFVAAYQKNPDPARAAALFSECTQNIIAKMAPLYAEKILEMVRQIADGAIEIDSYYIPRFNLEPHRIYLFYDGKEQYNVYKFAFEHDIAESLETATLLETLAELLPPLLDEMIRRGDFDCLADKLPVLAIGGHNRGGLYLRHVFSEVKAEEEKKDLETQIRYLEQDDDIAGHDLLLPGVVSALLDGVHMPPNEARARAILTRHLYSHEPDVVEIAAELCYAYGSYGYDDIRCEEAVWALRNGNGYGARQLGWLIEEGYKPAADRWAEFEADRERKSVMLAKYQSGGGAAKKQGKVGKDHFRQTFTEDDLLLNTDRVLARAYVNGEIYIRFRIEGERGYAEALDWLCNLLEKDYAELNDGYSITVRFLIKPMFIKQLTSATDDDGIGFAQNACHAFFARAVTYPALREKVKRYSELALRLYHWYKDLQDEDNCVTGTFAACALAFAEEQYVPMIGLFARNSDDEHQYIQMLVAGPLFKQYGATPEVAAALYDVQSSNGQGHDIRLNKALLTTPACLVGVMKHVSEGELGRWAPHHLEYHVPGYVEAIWGDNTKANLKKFKQFAEGAAAPEDKNAFMDFYNFYKSYASLRYKEDYGDDLEGVKEAKKDIVVPLYDSDPILPLKEAEKLGLHFDDDDVYEDKRCIVFFPALMDDPVLLDHILEQWDASGKIARSVNMTFAWWDEGDAGNGCFVFGKWVYDPHKRARDFGVILADGKNKPYVLYGILNAVQLASRWNSRPFKTAEEAENARLSARISESPKRTAPANSEEIALDKKLTNLFSALLKRQWWTARQIALTYKPEDGRFYDAARLIQAKVELEMQEFDEVAAIYDELSTRCPEVASYLAEKKAALGKKEKK